jgi:hypothetical protein
MCSVFLIRPVLQPAVKLIVRFANTPHGGQTITCHGDVSRPPRIVRSDLEDMCQAYSGTTITFDTRASMCASLEVDFGARVGRQCVFATTRIIRHT